MQILTPQMSDIVIRLIDKQSDDMRFVTAAWSRSYWEEHPGPPMDFKTYREAHAQHMKSLIFHSLVRAVQFADVPEILGFAVVQNATLHYVYVKHAFRRQHLAQALAHGCTEYSTWTKKGLKLADALHLTYNPYRKY